MSATSHKEQPLWRPSIDIVTAQNCTHDNGPICVLLSRCTKQSAGIGQSQETAHCQPANELQSCSPVGLHDRQAERRRPLHGLVHRCDDLRARRQPAHDGRRAVEQLPEAANDALQTSQKDIKRCLLGYAEISTLDLLWKLCARTHR